MELRITGFQAPERGPWCSWRPCECLLGWRPAGGYGPCADWRAWLFLPSCPHPKLSDAPPPQRVLAPCVCHIPCPVPHVLALGAPLLHPPGVSANELLLSWGASPGRRQMETARGTQAGPPRPQSVQWADCARETRGSASLPPSGVQTLVPDLQQLSSGFPLGTRFRAPGSLTRPQPSGPSLGSRLQFHASLLPGCSSEHRGPRPQRDNSGCSPIL